MADFSPNMTKDHTACGAVESARMIGNQWRLIVVRYLLEGPMRFNEILKIACGVDPKTLSRVLKYLTKQKIVRREVVGVEPFRVQYVLTEKGEQIGPIMQALKVWGDRWVLGYVSPERSRPSEAAREIVKG